MVARHLRLFLAALAIWLSMAGIAQAGGFDRALLRETVRKAAALSQLNALIVAYDGETVVARAFRGPGLDDPVNVKSVSKAVISALVGIAIDRGLLRGVDQPIVPLLGGDVPKDADPRLGEIAIGHLLSMQAGLERTSGPYYGRWVASPNWVRYAISRPFVGAPGGDMLYSTGNTHMLSAILTRVAERSTLALARDWIGAPLGIAIPPWPRDPQGIYFGGNDMALSPRALLRFGEMYRNGGLHEGKRVLPEDWVRASWTPRTRSRYTGDGHGYGWFIGAAHGHALYYARGYGGQLLYVVPSLSLTVVITSDSTLPARTGGYFSQLETLLTEGILPAALEARAAAPPKGPRFGHGGSPNGHPH